MLINLTYIIIKESKALRLYRLLLKLLMFNLLNMYKSNINLTLIR
jgi:hypothetical protein